MTTPHPRFVVATAMRNEGAFIVEWVTWYRMLGFEVLVATNDCTDHSPALLDALAAAGWLTHISHAPPVGVPPQKAAHALLHRHSLVQEADHVLTCDVDEFLVLHRHDDIAAFMADLPDALGIAFSWKTFGTGGWKRYQPGLTHRQFRRAGIARLKVNRPFKSMIRDAARFARLGAHTPHGFDGDWAAPEHRWINADGVVLPQFSAAQNHPIRFLEPAQISHATAQMNHYVLRSVEHYAAKKGTLSASSFADRYTDDFFARRDKNGTKDISAERFSPRFDALFGKAMALPDVNRLHHLCCADYVARLCAHQGRDHRDDPRWRSHRAQAV